MKTEGTIFISEFAISFGTVAAIGISVEVPLDRLIRLRDDMNKIIEARINQELLADLQRRGEDASNEEIEAPDHTTGLRWYSHAL